MKIGSLLVCFILGCVVLIVAFGIGWANWWEFANHTVVQALMRAIAIVVVLLLVMGFLNMGKER